MSNLVGVYYRPDGTIDSIVKADNDDFGPHDKADPTLTRVTLPKPAYDALPQVMNVAGLAVHYDLNKACAPLLMQKNPSIAAKCQANIDAVDAQVAADKAQAIKDAPSEAAYQAWWDALPPDQKQLVVDGILPGGP